MPLLVNNLGDKAPAASEATDIAPQNRIETVFLIEGMTCTGCENAIINRVAELKGVQAVDADHQAMETHVVYDKSKVSEASIIAAITDAGYSVTGKLE